MVLPCCWCFSGLRSCHSSGESRGEAPPLGHASDGSDMMRYDSYYS